MMLFCFRSELAKGSGPLQVHWGAVLRMTGFCLCILFSSGLLAQKTALGVLNASPLVRGYREGEDVAYKMQAVNEGHTSTIRYEAQVKGQVRLDASGTFYEDLAWADLSLNGQAVPLSSASQEFRERLSLSPQYGLSIPDLSKAQPGLIGPIVDLLTFYADVQLAMRQRLVRAGDRIYVKDGKPNSWADGRHVIFAQDAIDFDITLREVDEKRKMVTLVVRHVPPVQSSILFPVAWMRSSADGNDNNWAQVEKEDEGKYLAESGRESFDATIQLSLPSGRILSAVMNNPVDVVERDCRDAALSVCGAATYYQIHRRIVIDATNP